MTLWQADERGQNWTHPSGAEVEEDGDRWRVRIVKKRGRHTFVHSVWYRDRLVAYVTALSQVKP